jgi:hypothetical protein
MVLLVLYFNDAEYDEEKLDRAERDWSWIYTTPLPLNPNAFKG